MPIGLPDLIPLLEVFAVKQRDPAVLSLSLRQRLAQGETRGDECESELQRTP